MKRLITLAILVAFCSVPLAASAGRGHGRGFGKGGKILIKKAMKEAGLNDQQIRRIETLKLEADRAKIDIRAELEKGRLDFEQLTNVDKPNEAAVIKQLEKVHAIKLQLKKNHIKLMLQVRKEITPEQWNKLQELKAQFKMKRWKNKKKGSKRGRRGGPGGGGGFGGGGGPGGGGLR